MTIMHSIIVAFISLLVSVTVILFLEYILQSQMAYTAPLAIYPPPVYESATDTQIRTPQLFNMSLQYVLSSNACSRDAAAAPLAVFLVTSYAGHVEARSAMRRAVSQPHLHTFNIKRVFLLATAPASDKYAVAANALADEQRKFGDLLQGNFTEAYRNLTYKHVMGLQWVAQHCPQAKFIVKMDDDTVIDFHAVVKLLHHYEAMQRHQELFLAGYVLRGMVPKRDPANKWCVTRSEYAKSMYPPFVSGWFYVTTPKLSNMFARLSHSVPYFWIDDVYVTGILAALLKVRHTDIRDVFTPHPEFLECCIHDVDVHRYQCDVMVGPNGGDENLFVRFNEHMAKCRGDHCRPRPADKPMNQTCVAERKFASLGHGDALIEDYKLFK